MKAAQIEVSLGTCTAVPIDMIGMKVTLGNKGDEIGKITDVKIANRMLMATIAVDAEAQDLVGAFIMHDLCLLRPKINIDLPEIELNLQELPAEINLVVPEDPNA